MKPVLVVNAGSSSLKYQLVEPHGGALARGLISEIGSDSAQLRHDGQVDQRAVADHDAALAWMLEAFGGKLDDLLAVGHRVVHGGTRFTAPTLITAEVEAAIDELAPLAPLHNPANLAGIRALRSRLPDVPQVAVFDTAFHATIPAMAATYALPVELAAKYGVRRYGFHGTSCQYVTRASAAFLAVPAETVNLVICHLGNGASATAVAGGRSVDTSMGLGPLEGLVMGTRSGDLDPAIPFHLIRAGVEPAEVERVLTKESGLKGLAGASDMREVRKQAKDPAARLALDVYAYRIRKYIGAYLAVVPDVHAVVFTAGIGENDPRLRAEVCAPLSHLGLVLDATRNAGAAGPAEPVAIDDGSGPIRVLVVPTDEESEIASQTAAVVGSP